MIRALQINLNRSPDAHDLMDQTLEKGGYNLAALSEPNRARIQRGGYEVDDELDVAIWMTKKMKGRVKNRGRGKGFVWIDISVAAVYSCYVSPNIPLEKYQDILDELEESIGTWASGKLVIITGDFNAWAEEWGSTRTNARGEALLEMMSRRGLVLANDGRQPTFRRDGSESYLDLTWYSGEAANLVQDWRVLEIETLSDHRYVEFLINAGRQGGQAEGPPSRWRWNPRRLDKDTAKNYIHKESRSRGVESPEQLAALLEEACEKAAIGGPPGRSNRTKMKYWWSAEINEARRECVKLHRQCYRRRRRPEEAALAAEQYKSKKKELRRMIKRSKEKCWTNLCEEVEKDAYGQAYQIVMKKIGVGIPEMPPSLVREVVKKLFPERPVQEWTFNGHEDFSFVEVDEEEVKKAAERISVGKAPGVDGVPPEVVKEYMRDQANTFAGLANRLLGEGYFPERWKKARLVLLPKPDKPPEDPSSYRPLCLLDTAGKAFETILTKRLNDELEAKDAISENQYGFRGGRSTIDAILEVVETAEVERTKTWRTRRLCLLILLDVRNAFNSMPWEVVMEALKEKGVSPYLRRIIGSYLKDRSIVTASGETFGMTAGVPQGSILGPTLWNVAYDGVLEVDMPEGVNTVAYADDLAILVKAKDEEELTAKANAAMEQVAGWMEAHHLKLAPEKTEAALLIGKKRCGELRGLRLGEVQIKTKREVRYLGITLDQGLTFAPHIQGALKKAKRAVTALARIMPRTRGAGEGKRRLLATVATSIALYAAPVWEKALTKKRNVDRMLAVQRAMAIRVCRAYRTVDTRGVLVVARQIPWHLMADERKRRHEDRKEADQSRRKTKKERREETLNMWQEQWAREATGGQWTRRIIPDVKGWQLRRHGEVNYHLTQALTGHGCFQQYLCRVRKVVSPECPLCMTGDEDTAEHTIAECDFFAYERVRLQEKIGRVEGPEEIIQAMLECQENWEAVSDFVGSILSTKEVLERDRKKNQRTTAGRRQR